MSRQVLHYHPLIKSGSKPDEYPLFVNQKKHLDTIPEYHNYSCAMANRPFHCYTDDWRLESIWRSPEFSLQRALMSGNVIAPDYSVFLTMPIQVAIYHVFKQMQIAQYWQSFDVDVVPSLSWSTPETNRYIFPAYKHAQIIAVRAPSNEFLTHYQIAVLQLLSQNKSIKQVLHFGPKRGSEFWPAKVQVILKSLNPPK